MNPHDAVSSIAPEFDDSVVWMNCPPLAMASLRGHPVLLLFWNAGSAHCHNALQSVATLASRFRDSVAVLAVHVPKFDYERDGTVAWEALQAEGALLPLAHDVDWAVWQQYGVTAWPTAVLIDASGSIRERVVGDAAIEAMAPALEALADENFSQVSGQIELPRLENPTARGALSAPGGLVATSSRLYIADTGHHRILECTHDGRILRRIGHGNRDLVDGLADVAGFNSPRGMVILQDRLYVADTGNHSIRRINTRTGEVDTLLGTGRRGESVSGTLKEARDSPLDRPWGLAATQSGLLFTQASGHQLWSLQLGTSVLSRVSGRGTFGHEDGTANDATFAQPTALTLVGEFAYVLDTAASALRQVKLTDGSVRTLFGRGLFEFGAKDGGIRHALMQSPMALAAMSGGAGLWIADTGNGALRKWISRTQALSTVELPNTLRRPTALASWQNHLWIADSGSHLIWRLDVESGAMHRLPVGE